MDRVSLSDHGSQLLSPIHKRLSEIDLPSARLQLCRKSNSWPWRCGWRSGYASPTRWRWTPAAEHSVPGDVRMASECRRHWRARLEHRGSWKPCLEENKQHRYCIKFIWLLIKALN